jgi:hypothetical protein
MGESGMVDGEASVMMMAMISSKSLSRQSARMEFLVPNRGFWWWRRSVIRHGVDDVSHHPVGNPKRKV